MPDQKREEPFLFAVNPQQIDRKRDIAVSQVAKSILFDLGLCRFIEVGGKEVGIIIDQLTSDSKIASEV